MNVLVVGSGGREHALCWAIAKSPKLGKLFAAPGNAGMAQIATCLNVAADNTQGIVDACRANKIDFVMVGPEGPLVAGLADALTKAGIKVFGPHAAAAQLEGSKGFMKDVCKLAGVPTAAYARFNNHAEAIAYIQKNGAPIVVKADGLAAGKGVTVAMTMDDAIKAVDDAMLAKTFGDAGAEVVIEEYMDGEEASFFALVDGEKAIAFASAQDHKRAFDGDKGPNTGGMGAYSPAPVMTEEMNARVMNEIVLPTARYMARQGTPFRGILFAGLMITKTGPRLIEYNVRFGDPETEAMLPRLKSDLLEVLVATAEGKLETVKLEWLPQAVVTVVMAANGYPGNYVKNTVINGLDAAAKIPAATVFHAGTVAKDGQVIATGGRVLAVTGFGADVKTAQGNAYKAVDAIKWPEGFCRRDIGWRAL